MAQPRSKRKSTETLTGKKRTRTKTRLLLPNYIINQVQVRSVGYYITKRGKKVAFDHVYWRDATKTEDELINGGDL